ncbi:Uncharacterized protein FWK35_00007820 [Aphis craccivora]|uniref:Uncharacterized protein n=1 Tax=Aphis craccivora TaxID=307492 RepID=A0A6G0YMG9_APHCR|nr:Uncharacterized protein FWK35_00007820 [Aphis craccivora]
MGFGIQSVGTLSGRSSRINAATGKFDVGSRLTVSKDEAFGNSRGLPLRRRSPGLHAGYGAIINKRPVPCSRITGQGLRIFRRQRITGHGERGFKRFSESQATVDVATTAIINRKTSAGGSGDYKTPPPPINISAEHKIDQYAVLPYCSKTYQGRLTRFGRFCLHNLTVARPTQGRLAQFCYTVKTTKTSTKKIPQVSKIQSTVKARYKTTVDQ